MHHRLTQFLWKLIPPLLKKLQSVRNENLSVDKYRRLSLLDWQCTTSNMFKIVHDNLQRSWYSEEEDIIQYRMTQSLFQGSEASFFLYREWRLCYETYAVIRYWKTFQFGHFAEYGCKEGQIYWPNADLQGITLLQNSSCWFHLNNDALNTSSLTERFTTDTSQRMTVECMHST